MQATHLNLKSETIYGKQYLTTRILYPVGYTEQSIILQTTVNRKKVPPSLNQR